PSEPRTPEWIFEVVSNAKVAATDDEGNFNEAQYHDLCMKADVSGSFYHPFWEDLPYCNIFDCMTPDVLHQIYQGVLKYMIIWAQELMSKKELDARISKLPRCYGVRHFKNGISNLSQVSGSERKQIAHILLACLVGKVPKRPLIAIRALLDFAYIAQYPSHDEDTLSYLRDAFDTFHQHKDAFIEFGCRKHLNIPKFHSLFHYLEAIPCKGTTDNYNTEMFERLHIDFAKEGWRASNHRDEFPQMVRWLSRRKKMVTFRKYI
ncbi:hypothetical protein FISHEDRAFT_30931, partial [Fistulina hepatica ATCC 64428]